MSRGKYAHVGSCTGCFLTGNYNVRLRNKPREGLGLTRGMGAFCEKHFSVWFLSHQTHFPPYFIAGTVNMLPPFLLLEKQCLSHSCEEGHWGVIFMNSYTTNFQLLGRQFVNKSYPFSSLGKGSLIPDFGLGS